MKQFQQTWKALRISLSERVREKAGRESMSTVGVRGELAYHLVLGAEDLGCHNE